MARSYQLVLDGIESDLAAGRLLVGGKLPAERALAERYQVSRPTVREAVRILEALGVVRTAVGSGPDAGATVTAEPAAPIGAVLRWHLASRALPVADIVQARVLIESWAVGEAAGRGDRPGMDTAEALLDQMDDESITAAEFLSLDARFHVTLAVCAGNAVIAAVMAAMRTGIETYVTEALTAIGDWSAVSGRLRVEHRGILDAVREGRPDQASTRVADHILGFYETAGLGDLTADR